MNDTARPVMDYRPVAYLGAYRVEAYNRVKCESYVLTNRMSLEDAEAVVASLEAGLLGEAAILTTSLGAVWVAR
jgi:hypothetical protein